MRNRLQILELNGEVLNPDFVSDVLNNLDRFTNHLQDAREIVEKMGDGNVYKPEKLQAISIDFFEAWVESSTELILHIGRENALEFLTLFRPYWFMTWPQSSYDYMDQMGLSELLENTKSNDTSWEWQIFRGESPSLVAQGIQGFSWSFHKHIAEYYAKRHQDGVVLSAKIKWDDVLVILDSEHEVVVSPSWLKSVVAGNVST